MISKKGSNFDIIIISGEYYDDHPLSPVGVIARVLDAKGYSVGIIEKPETKTREVEGLVEACGFFGLDKGIIVTEDHSDNERVSGIDISYIPLWEFCSEAIFGKT